MGKLSRLTGAPTRRGVAILSAVVGTLWTGLLLARLYIGGAVGLADQGDGIRMVCSLGVRNDRPWAARINDFVYPTWVDHQWFGETCGANGSGEPYYSSHTLVLWLAKQITPLLGYPGALDLRAAGVLLAVLSGGLLTLLVLCLPGSLLIRFLVASGVGLVLADSAFASYFISPYSEASGLLGILALCVAMLFMWRSRQVSVLGIAAVIALALFTITAKTQLASLVLPVLIAVLWSPSWGLARQRGESEPEEEDDTPATPEPPAQNRTLRAFRWLGRFARTRWPALLLSVLLLVGTMAFLANQPKRFSELNMYNAVFLEILPYSPDPEADLRELGVDPSLVSAIGTNILSPKSAVNSPHYQQFREKVTLSAVVKFQLSHPGRLMNKMDRGLRAVGQPTLDYVGSYMAGSGHKPLEKESRVTFFTAFLEVFAGGQLLMVVFLLFIMVLGFVVATQHDFSAKLRALGRLSVVLVFAIWSQFWAVMFTEGASEIYKHMIYVGFMTALCLPLSIGMITVMVSQVRRRNRLHFEEAEAESKPLAMSV